MTPRSMTSKLLHCSTTPTMFLPMSCTSPLTVATTMRPLERCAPASLLCSMNGTRCATARFMTRALVENQSLARRPHRRLDLPEDAQLSGIHDPHVHAGGNGVVEEHRVHPLAPCVFAAKRERPVAPPAAHQRVRQLALDAARGL